jgi:hypothetical protein
MIEGLFFLDVGAYSQRASQAVRNEFPGNGPQLLIDLGRMDNFPSLLTFWFTMLYTGSQSCMAGLNSRKPRITSGLLTLAFLVSCLAFLHPISAFCAYSPIN